MHEFDWKQQYESLMHYTPHNEIFKKQEKESILLSPKSSSCATSRTI